MSPVTARLDDAVVVLVDCQQRFTLAVSSDCEPALARIEHLLLVAGKFEIPVIATVEEPVERKGALHDRFRSLLPVSGKVFSKLAYDLTAEPDVRAAIEATNRTQCIVAGLETDVCVLQSVLGLLRMGLTVFVVEDCTMSSCSDTATAINRMSVSGAIASRWKSIYYELIGRDDLEDAVRAELGRSPEELS